MNKQNLLSRAEMKKVMGGNDTTPEIVDDGFACEDWKTKPDICYNCCITVHSADDCANNYCKY